MSTSEKIFFETLSESLNLEIKPWFKIDTPDGKYTLIRTCFGLRNRGGGRLVIGFDDNSNQLPKPKGINVKTKYHIDKLQSIISEYASDKFQIIVNFQKINKQFHPIIIVPSDVKTPVVTDKQLKNKSNVTFIDENVLFFRTLNANNTPSTSQIKKQDWEDLIDICFNNKQADIGKFLDSHAPEFKKEISQLTGKKETQASELVSDLSKKVIEYSKLNYEVGEIEKLISDSNERFNDESEKRKIDIRDHGYWEVGLIIDGKINKEHNLNDLFISLLNSVNPKYSGWPIWLIIDNFKYENAKPYVFDDFYEEFIYWIKKESFYNHIEFMRFNPKGKFYQRRAYEYDINKDRAIVRDKRVIDYKLPILRTIECMGVGVALAKGMGYNLNDTKANFLFKWNDLRDRELVSWTDTSINLIEGRKSKQNNIDSFCSIPLNIPLEEKLHEFVYDTLKSLYSRFREFSLSKDYVKEIALMVLQRRMSL